jgi:hypothetical protein
MDIILPASVNVNPFLVGAGGLDVGVFATNNWYAVYVIASSNYPVQYVQEYSQPIAPVTSLPSVVAPNPFPPVGLLSLSATPQLPYGYDSYRRVGWANTIGNSGPISFNQFYVFDSNDQSRIIYYDDYLPTAALPASPSGYDIFLVTVDGTDNTVGLIPPIAAEVKFTIQYAPGAAGNTIEFQLYGASNTTPTLQIGAQVVSVALWSTFNLGLLQDPAGSPALKYRNDAGDSTHLFVSGFVDRL